MGITAILSLQTEEDLKERGTGWEEKAALAANLTFQNVPVEDFDTADLERNLPYCVVLLELNCLRRRPRAGFWNITRAGANCRLVMSPIRQSSAHLGSSTYALGKQGYSLEGSIKTTSEFSRKRSNTICFPSGVTSKVRMAPRF